MTRRSRAWPWHAAALLITFHTLLAFGLPPLVPVAGTVLLGVFYAFIGARNGLLVAASLAVATLLYAGMLALVDWESAVYYRPHERLATHDTRRDHAAYEPERHLQMRMPHGDLQSMTREDIAEPRPVEFVTDARGFRNRADYAGEPYLLVGDSFIAGNSNTQEDLLGEQLARVHGVRAYHLGHPGDLDDYLAYVEAFRADHGDAAKVLLFLFEGNDFPVHGRYRPPTTRPLVHRLYKRWFRMWSHTGVYRFTASVYRRWRHGTDVDEGAQVIMGQMAGRPAAFYREYVEVSRAAGYAPDPAYTQRLRAALAGSHRVFFIPTKFRVYHAGAALPHARWTFLARLCNATGARCTDLTPALVEAAAAAAPAGETVYWRDDTHWNRRGMAVAAREVARALGAAVQTPPPPGG